MAVTRTTFSDPILPDPFTKYNHCSERICSIKLYIGKV
jgi:hypothetical protein